MSSDPRTRAYVARRVEEGRSERRTGSRPSTPTTSPYSAASLAIVCMNRTWTPPYPPTPCTWPSTPSLGAPVTSSDAVHKRAALPTSRPLPNAGSAARLGVALIAEVVLSRAHLFGGVRRMVEH